MGTPLPVVIQLELRQQLRALFTSHAAHSRILYLREKHPSVEAAGRKCTSIHDQLGYIFTLFYDSKTGVALADAWTQLAQSLVQRLPEPKIHLFAAELVRIRPDIWKKEELIQHLTHYASKVIEYVQLWEDRKWSESLDAYDALVNALLVFADFLSIRLHRGYHQRQQQKIL